MGPLEAKRRIAAGAAARYNGAALQRQRITQRLRQGPATRDVLARECYSPCVTKRLSELRRAGLPIRTCWVEERAPDGTANAATLYSLADEADPAQLSLTFE